MSRLLRWNITHPFHEGSHDSGIDELRRLAARARDQRAQKADAGMSAPASQVAGRDTVITVFSGPQT